MEPRTDLQLGSSLIDDDDDDDLPVYLKKDPCLTLIRAPIAESVTYIMIYKHSPDKEVDIYIPDFNLYKFLCNAALARFNSNEGTKFTFVKVVNWCLDPGVKCSTHINFLATEHSDGGGGDVDEFFYAELLHECGGPNMEDEINDEDLQVEVNGCCLLQKVDTPNPLANGCCTCTNMMVMHPGPRDGYRIVAGDPFESSNLMGYNMFKVREARDPESPWARSKEQHTSNYNAMFEACGRRALLDFNTKQKSQFQLVKVDRGFSVDGEFATLAHVNILAEWPEKFEEPKLFFLEAIIPSLTSQRLGEWYPFLEDYIEIRGCCQLIKRERDVPRFRRVCEVCISGVIHPGPNEGHDIAAGDDFRDGQFMEVGSGYFTQPRL